MKQTKFWNDNIEVPFFPFPMQATNLHEMLLQEDKASKAVAWGVCAKGRVELVTIANILFVLLDVA